MIERSATMAAANNGGPAPEVSVAPGRPPLLAAPSLAMEPAWLSEHRDRLRDLVSRHGALLVRGLGITDAGQAAEVSTVLLDEVMAEQEPFAPRTALSPGLYSGTHWPSDQPMCMHHELSYGPVMPGLLVFTCLAAPTTGGATALADAAAVLDDLPDDLVARFEASGWQLRRVYNDLIGIPWQEAFGTTDRSEVERYCAEHAIEYRWNPGGLLRTVRRCPAVRVHPATGARLWCNQIAFLNEWTIDPAVRAYLTAEFGPDGLPYTTTDGDGVLVDESTVELINEVYARHTVAEPWQAGDLLVVDNLGIAHSREPFEGERSVAVAMGDPVPIRPPCPR